MSHPFRRNRFTLTPLALILAAAAAAPLGLAAAHPAETSGGEAEAHEAHEDAPITKTMERINEHYKRLRREARRLRFDQSTIERVVEMQQLALKAMHQEVPLAQEKEGEARKKFVIGFKKQMARFIGTMFDLEVALLEERKEDAAELINKLAELKKEGHDEYTEGV